MLKYIGKPKEKDVGNYFIDFSWKLKNISIFALLID